MEMAHVRESAQAEAKKAAAEKTAKKLAARKIDHEAEAKKDMKKEALKVAKKMAQHKDPSGDHRAKDTHHTSAAVNKADDEKTADAKEEASVVKDALKIAKSMSEHKDPVYKPPVKKAHDDADSHEHKSEHKSEHKVGKATMHSLQHQGLLQKSKALEKLVHEAKHAHGAAKSKLKARVMQLQQEITDGTKAVEKFGDRAKTAFQRAEAKEHATHGSRKAVHTSRRDMTDAQRLKADGWH